jgi:hypothetical protein
MSTTTTSTAIADFADRQQAQRAVCELACAGFVPTQMRLLGPGDPMPEMEEDEARYYHEVTEEGRTLVFIEAGEGYPQAMDILSRCGGEFVAPYTPPF